MINVQKVSFFSMSNLIFVSLSCLSCECRKNLFGNDVTAKTTVFERRLSFLFCKKLLTNA